MIRALATLLIVAVAAVIALWQLDVLALPFLETEAAPAVASADTLTDAAEQGDLEAVRTALESGTDVDARDPFGRTALMRAAATGQLDVLEELLERDADVHATSADGRTALMFAAESAPTPRAPLLLLQAGADPTVVDDEGRTAAALAEDNGAVRNSGLYPRLVELAERPFVRGWPSAYQLPVDGATLSSRANHLPGAPRAYRNGTHEGFDFYDGTVSVEIEYGTPQRAVADGVVIRADHDYEELTLEGYRELIDAATRDLTTPGDVLDALRGRQVWIRHAGGYVTRYAHLSGIAENVAEGEPVVQGQVVGFTGNSGTEEAARDTEEGPHPHIEIWRGDTYLGQNLEPDEIYRLAAQVFGTGALPPFTDTGQRF